MAVKTKGMINSVGTRPAACVKSILDYSPEYVLFFVSTDTRKNVGEIKTLVEEQGGKWPIYTEIAETIDFEDISICYLTLVEEEPKWRAKYKLQQEEIMVDYTGGSKVMTAALVLYGVNYFDRFSYTGGTQRGLDGSVENGHEKLVHSINPLDATILSKRQLWHIYSQAARYEIIAEEAGRYSRSLEDERNMKFCQIVNRIYKAVSAYDRFSFDSEYSFVDEFHDSLQDLSVFAASLRSPPLQDWYEKLVKLESHFKRLKDDPEQKHREWAIALIANAKRRADLEGKYEEAVACLYNALERIEQMLIRKHYKKAEAGDFPPSKIPVSLTKIFERNPKNRKGNYRVGLDKGMRLLSEKGVSFGEKYIRNANIIWRNSKNTGLLDIRNNSLRGHGFNPVGKAEYERWWNEFQNLWDYDYSELPIIPDLPEIWW